jgi:hypothetical protein
MAVDISVVMTFHKEGRINHRALESLDRSLGFPKTKGKNVEAYTI